MLLLTGEARFAELIERTLYNGFLAGIGLDGTSFFYVNPLQARQPMTRSAWNYASILPDDEGGGMLAVQHLLATGRSHIGHITGPASFRASRLRAAGAERVLAGAGLSLAGGKPLYGEWSEVWGRQAARILLRAAPDTDAVFCGSDQIARGVAEMLRELGSRVPDDISLVGFDNWTVMAEAAQPPLTTIDMNLPEVGRMAAEVLLSAIAGQAEHGTRTVPSRLVVRSST